MINDQTMLDSQKSKSLLVIGNIMGHILETVDPLSWSLEMLELACDDLHFVGLFEIFYKKLNNFGQIRALSLIKLPVDLLITDLNLMERVG